MMGGLLPQWRLLPLCLSSEFMCVGASSFQPATTFLIYGRQEQRIFCSETITLPPSPGLLQE